MQITRKEFISEPKDSVNQRKYFEGMTIELINLFQDLEVSLVVEMMKGSKKKKKRAIFFLHFSVFLLKDREM